MALNLDTTALSSPVQRILAQAETRSGRPLLQILSQRSMNDVIRMEIVYAVDKAIAAEAIPASLADLVEAAQ